MTPEKLGPFKIGRVLGRGGMGTVYEGTSVLDGSVAAIKVLSEFIDEDEDAEVRLRFEAEIDTLKRLRHPNIVRLSGFGEEQGQLYYVMELVNGASLQQELRKKRPFQWHEAAKIGLDICQALRHAHDRGVIHRDIKPANILLDQEGNVKLSDFGIARFFGSQQITDVHSIIGTLEYMAPEQALAQPITSCADLYSLGCVLYILLTGKPPYSAHSLPEMLRKYQSTTPPLIHTYRNDIPEDLEYLVSDLLQIRPEDRPRNALLTIKRLQSLLQALMGPPESIKILPMASEISRRHQESVAPSIGSDSSADSSPQHAPSPDNMVLRRDEVLCGKASDQSLSARSPSAQQEFDERLIETKTASSVWSPPQKHGAESSSFDISFKAVSDSAVLRHGDVILSKGHTLHPSEDEPLPDAAYLTGSLRSQTTDSVSHQLAAKTPETHSAGTNNESAKLSGTPSAKVQNTTTRFVAIEEKNLDPFEDEDRPDRSTMISLPVAVTATMLMIVGLTVYFLLQPASPETLFEQITASMKEKENVGELSLSLQISAQKTIQQFLSAYPDHPSAEQVRYFQDELDLLEHERRLERRTQFSGQRSLSPVERAYIEVLTSSPNDSEQMIENLRAFIDVFRTGEPSSVELSKPHRAASSPVDICVELAQRRLKKLEQVVEEINQEQEQVIRRRLEEAANWDFMYPSHADDIRRGIIKLYQNHRWARDVVEEAKQQLNE